MSKVRYGRNELPPLSEERKAELKSLNDILANKVDFSDIPPLDDAFWKNVVRNPFYRPVKFRRQ